jgi:hypothetical protein
LTSAFDIEEIPALRVRAGSKVPGTEKLAPKQRVKKRPHSKLDAAVHLKRTWKNSSTKAVEQFANNDAGVQSWR